MRHLFLVPVCALLAGQAQAAGFSGSAGLTSDYIFRGISQSNEDPALQANLDYNFDNGIKLGVWGSNVNFGDATLETDLYAAYLHNWGPVSFEGGFIAYLYPGAKKSQDFDYYEPYANFGYDFGPAQVNASLNYSPDYFAGSGDMFYPRLAAKVPLSHGFALDGWVGHIWIEQDAAYGVPDYTDWALGVAYTYERVTAKLQYTDTDLPASSCADGCDARVLASVAWSF